MRSVLGCLLALTVSMAALAAPPSRSETDLDRDARDQPQVILDFTGIQTGMRVADLLGGGGYYSELLQARVGDNGHVLLYNNKPYQQFAQQDQHQRFVDGRLAAIERRVADAADMQLGTATLDAALMVMAFHDVYWVDEKEGWPAIDRADFIAQVAKALKPGGVFVVVDHAAQAGSGMDAVNALHRIDESFVRTEVEAQGLRFEAASDLLRNPHDGHDQHVFNPAIRGHTDRFVLRFRKPE